MHLPAHPASCSLARELTLDLLQSWGLAALGEAAVQLVAELTANSIMHSGCSTLRLRVTRRGGAVRIEVRDPSHALPLLIQGDPDDDHGRGMHLVDALADRWGADLLPYGKGVWCDLHIARG
ncbi:ATP-binding protein [Streptacidiphilus carbonis]|uniref:ATP-binding protein n=1 Tax=Streptacidiphilus carbonis TaxID=105422 RepID=UPI000694350A|nr:ATP-binding protein [Streptacidiphilus carbonis]